MKLAARIGAGFGAILTLLAAVGGFGLYTVASLSHEIERGADMTGDALLASELNADMAKALLYARQYMATRDDEHLANTREFLGQTEDGIAAAQHEIDKIERAERVAKMAERIGAFGTGVDRVVELYGQRDEIYARLSDDGRVAVENLTQLADAAARDGDLETAFKTAKVQEHFLLVRLHVMKFMLDNEPTSVARFIAELQNVDEELQALQRSITNPNWRELAGEVDARLHSYEADATEISEIILERNEIRAAAIDNTGFAISGLAAEIKDSAAADAAHVFEEEVAAVRRAMTATGGFVAVGLIGGIAIAVLLGRAVSRPLTTITRSMGVIAKGDYAAEVPYRDRKDEVGAMAAALQVFKAQGLERKQLTARLADTFESEVGGVIETVAKAAGGVQTTAGEVKIAAGATKEQTASVAAAAEEASANVQTVAGAAEEMAASVREISGQLGESQKIAGKAADAASRVATTMTQLVESASKISGVVELITAIAEQTNLLSLNATIEAARAGEAGRGFAVVAQEVKSLAGQTAKATQEIAAQIGELQSVSKATAGDVEGVGQVIEQMNEIASSIAAAMEEQAAATEEIARNVQEAAQGNGEVSQIVSEVARIAGDSDNAALDLTAAATTLGGHASDLDAKVRTFLEGLRAA